MSRHNGDHGTIDVVNPWLCPVVWVVVGVQECTQIDENGSSKLFCGIRVHCLTVTDRRESKGVYTDRRRRPLGAVSWYPCTLLQCEL